MPRVRALGSPQMQAAAEARRAAEKAAVTPDRMRCMIKGLQALAGYDSLKNMCRALNINERRIRYMMDHPETCTMKEAVVFQALAQQLNYPMFEAFSLPGL